MRTTKAQLEAQVAALNAQVAELQAALAQAQAALVQASAVCEALDAEQQAARTPSRRVAAAMPAWQAERAAQMALAKEMAMRSGRSVKVSA